MPRQPRSDGSVFPCHVIQRGINRSDCFFDECDYAFYLECLQDACEKYGCDVHAYVLMTNHVHLLLTPHSEKSLSQIMQSVGRRYVKWINTVYKRTGTLWEGRYKSSLVGSDDYVLACYRYIELNPVRARMVETPEVYQWSSFRMNSGIDQQYWLVRHASYNGLANNEKAIFSAYEKLFVGRDRYSEWITAKTLKEQPIASDEFKDKIEVMLNVKFNREKTGKPKK